MRTATFLIACYFEPAVGSGKWPRLARVLSYTAERHCRAWTRWIEILSSPAPRGNVASGHLHNSYKLARWNERVQAARDGDRLLLLDTDTVILQPLDDLWSEAFDFAYTVKPARPGFNAGVVAMQVSDRAKRFMAAWSAANDRLLEDYQRPGMPSWQLRYGGANQASLAGLLPSAADDYGLAVRPLPCVEWNCEDSSWSDFGPTTRIVHVKGDLRRMLFNGPLYAKRALAPLAEVWLQLERDLAAHIPVEAR